MNMLSENELEATLDVFKAKVLDAVVDVEIVLGQALGEAITDSKFNNILAEMQYDNRNSVNILVNALEDAVVQVVEYIENQKCCRDLS